MSNKDSVVKLIAPKKRSKKGDTVIQIIQTGNELVPKNNAPVPILPIITNVVGTGNYGRQALVRNILVHFVEVLQETDSTKENVVDWILYDPYQDYRHAVDLFYKTFDVTRT